MDNVSGNLCSILLCLVEHPEIKDKLYEVIKNEFADEITYESLMENAYLDAVYKENLRLRNTILALNRTAIKDCKIGDFKIEKGTGISLILYVPQTHPGMDTL